MMVIFKVLAGAAVLAVLCGTFWLVNEVRSEAAVPQLNPEAIPEGELPEVSPGESAFEQASELLATSDFLEAREKLEFIVGIYPGSKSAGEARRILGELNLDKLLSTDDMEGKAVHTVGRGDTFLGIARKHETTLDCIMHMNGLQGLDRLHPGDELVVMPLKFNVKIEVAKKRLSLMKEGRFLKAYELVDARVRAEDKKTLRTTVKQKMGIVDGNAVPVGNPRYRSASKMITLAKQGLQIREVAEVDEESLGRGFFLRKPDIEELVLLMRVGNEVEIRFVNN